ncbi:Coatomer subunit epsilon [Yarrowia sp. B02]|nr:Coatomer subunit epsilon [Yarrowia sp. B02]
MSTIENILDARLAFFTGDYKSLVAASPSEIRDEHKDAVAFLKYRAEIAGGLTPSNFDDVSSPATVEALKAYAKFVASGHKDAAVLASLASANTDNEAVQLFGATGLYLEGKLDEALSLLEKHEGSFEAVLLIARILVDQNKIDAAQKLIHDYARTSDDDVAYLLASAIVAMRANGDDHVRSAYYIFEDLSQHKTANMLLGQALTEIQLGRIDEAKETLTKVDEVAPQDPNALVAKIVVGLSDGDDVTELKEELKKVDAKHPIFEELAEKNALFDKVVLKYADKIVA